MPLLIWRGQAPTRQLHTALETAKWQIRSQQDAGGNTPVVVFTSTSRRVPAHPADKPWLWVTGDTPSDARNVEAIVGGAYAVISLRSPDAARELIGRLQELGVTDAPPPAAPHMVAVSAASKAVLAQAARVAGTSMPVLLTGETGTGKEIISRLLHSWSPRSKKTFVPINCAAIPNELMEAELFGYARGAFSGAVQRYDGQLTAAEGGTVLLDEIDDTPLETQVKLLRVLEDRVVSRLGENVWREVDFRLIAATNRDLTALVDAGLFGADLYERLAIVSIHLVPLRERLEDLPQLADHFIHRFAREQQRPPIGGIRPDALRALAAYSWPGNIRELRNVVYETLVYKRAGSEILLSDLPRRILKRDDGRERDAAVDRSALTRKIERGTMNLRAEVMALQRMAIDEALKRTGGNAAQAAKLLGELGRGTAHDPGGTLRAMMRRMR